MMGDKPTVKCYFGELMRLAKVCADAKMSGDAEAYEKAVGNLKAYEQVCLEADEMLLGVTADYLDSRRYD